MGGVCQSYAFFLASFLLASCGERPPKTLNLVWTPNPNPCVPLALIGHLEADRPVRVRVTLDDGERPTTLERWPEYQTEHDLVVLGLHPATAYTISTEVEDESGATSSSKWTCMVPRPTLPMRPVGPSNLSLRV